MKLALSDGGHLHYEIHGDRGPWLMFFNGAMSSTTAWLELVPAMVEKHRLLLVDFRDQGQSSRREPGYRVEDQCADILALLDHLRIERTSIMGISYGGLAAIAFARWHGDRVARLVLASVTAKPSQHLRAAGHAWEAVAELGDPRLLLRVCSPLVYARGFYERRRDWLEQRIELIAGLLDRDWLQAFIRISRSARDADFCADLAAIAAPTLLLCGTEDALMDPRAVFAMAEHIPDCQTLAIPGAGHALFVEKSAEIASAILGFTAR